MKDIKKDVRTDLDDILKALEANEKQMKEGTPGVVTETHLITNHDFYDSDMYELRKGIAVTALLDDGTEITEFISLPKPQAMRKSNIWAFKEKFGSYPTSDVKINAKVNDEGFYRIDYPHVEVTE